MSTLARVVAALESERVHFAVVGGLALALHGRPRGTMDIDFVIEHSEKQFEACEKALKKAGLVPRLPVTAKEVFQFRNEYLERRNLIAWSFYNPTNPVEIVDIILTIDCRDIDVVKKNFALQKIPVVGIVDLIAMKKKSGRPQDLEDIRMLQELQNDKKKPNS